MQFKTDSASAAANIDNQHVAAMMRNVIYALLPAVLTLFWFFGWGVLSNLVLAIGFAVLLEILMLKLRQRPIIPFLSDYSAVVSGALLGLAMPSASPWWLLLIAVFFAIVIAKQLYGGLGYNPFNPAMIGYAVVLVSFPVEMTRWLSPLELSFAVGNLDDTLSRVLSLSTTVWDGVTMATPLDYVKTNLMRDISLTQSMSEGIQFGWLAGKAWEWVSLAYLVGGLWLIYKKVITWHIPVALLLTLSLISSLFWLIDANTYASPLFHLLSGATMLGAFFIATDPVSASTTPMGKLIYAAGIAFFIYIIRIWGAYPDGVAFAIIIMNMAAPMIDHYSQPKIFGE
jgi:electron transport complex protein RnfD